LDKETSLRTGLLRSLFCCLRIEGAGHTQRLASVLEQARLSLTTDRRLSDDCLDRRLPKKETRPLLLNKDDTINKARYEWYLYLQIPERLNGQLMLPDVVKYRALDADLDNPIIWRQEKETLLQVTQQPKLSDDPKRLIPVMATELSLRLHEVSHYLEKTDNRDVILRPKEGKRHWRLPTASKKHLVNNPFFEKMRSIGVADVLRVVDQDTGFIDDFEHVLGMSSKSRQYEVDLLAILIANATNQGIYGMAQISDRSYDQLSIIQANYLRLETLNAANDRINNATTRLSIFKHYNIQEDNLHASADGQKFEAKRETFRTRYSSKYFGTSKGVSAISLNAIHMAINARVIGANEHESHFIFDLLMNNSTEIIPDVLSTDTHGVNHVNFALLDLFDYRFAPRYARVGKIIDDADLRNHVQRALNRGEAYHQLRRAISNVNGDRFRDNSDEEILIWNECARLMTNAIIYFNSKVLSNLLDSFEYQGKTKLADTLKRASPVAWQNINLRGTYLFENIGELPKLEDLMATIEGYLPAEEK